MSGRILAAVLALMIGCQSTRGTLITMGVGGAVLASTAVVVQRSDEHTEACCGKTVFIAVAGVGLGSVIVLAGLINLVILKVR